MKSKKLILALTATLIMGLGVTTYAATTNNGNAQNSQMATTTYEYGERHGNCEEGLTYRKGQGLNKTSDSSTHQRASLRRITGTRGYDFIKIVLKDKLGVTDAEIQSAQDSGKSLHDLALEKGLTEDEFKNALIEEKNKAIDKAVSDGTISQEEGDSAKNIIKSNAESED